MRLDKADSNKNLLKVISSGFKNVLEMWFAITPVIMAFGTIALYLLNILVSSKF